MAAQNTGKITQVIGAVLDIRFDKGVLPEINDAVEIRRKRWLHAGCRDSTASR